MKIEEQHTKSAGVDAPPFIVNEVSMNIVYYDDKPVEIDPSLFIIREGYIDTFQGVPGGYCMACPSTNHGPRPGGCYR